MCPVGSFREEILIDIDWRMSQLATAKSLPYRYSLSKDHRTFLINYSIPIIYAIWEGYVKNSFEIYTRELNKLGFEMNQFSSDIIVHSMEREFSQFKNPITNYQQIANFIKKLLKFVGNDFKVSSNIPTESNINLKVINNILSRYGLDTIPTPFFKAGLDKLLKFRNSIAHGEKNIIVSPENIFEFSSLITNLMYEVFIRIDKGYTNGNYKAIIKY